MNTIGLNKDDWDKCFKLMADVDLSAYTGTQFNLIGNYAGYSDPDTKAFEGIFDIQIYQLVIA